MSCFIVLLPGKAKTQCGRLSEPYPDTLLSKRLILSPQSKKCKQQTFRKRAFHFTRKRGRSTNPDYQLRFRPANTWCPKRLKEVHCHAAHHIADRGIPNSSFKKEEPGAKLIIYQALNIFWKEPRLRVEIEIKAEIWKPQLCLADCVTWNKLIYLSELQSPLCHIGRLRGDTFSGWQTGFNSDGVVHREWFWGLIWAYWGGVLWLLNNFHTSRGFFQMVLCLLDIYLFLLDKLISKIFSSAVFRIIWLRSIHLSSVWWA